MICSTNILLEIFIRYPGVVQCPESILQKDLCSLHILTIYVWEIMSWVFLLANH